METENKHIIYDELLEAQSLIFSEIQCVIDNELYKEYQLVLNKIESAIQIIKKYDIIP